MPRSSAWPIRRGLAGPTRSGRSADEDAAHAPRDRPRLTHGQTADDHRRGDARRASRNRPSAWSCRTARWSGTKPAPRCARGDGRARLCLQPRGRQPAQSSNAGLIGLVINDLRNPFFTEFATSLQMALSARGYATVMANTDEDPALQAQVVGAMMEHGVSALVVSPAYGDEAATFDAIARAGVPDAAGPAPVAAPRPPLPLRRAGLPDGQPAGDRAPACHRVRDASPLSAGLKAATSRRRACRATCRCWRRRGMTPLAPARSPRPRLRARGRAPTGARSPGRRCGPLLQRSCGAWAC